MNNKLDTTIGKLNVLILEDNRYAIKKLKEALQLKYDITLTRKSKKALEHFDKASVDVIICGVHLYNESMFDFLKQVRKREKSRGVPFVCFRTGDSQIAKLTDLQLDYVSRLLGANDYIAISDDCDSTAMCLQIETSLKTFFDADDSYSNHQELALL